MKCQTDLRFKPQARNLSLIAGVTHEAFIRIMKYGNL